MYVKCILRDVFPHVFKYVNAGLQKSKWKEAELLKSS